jgi:hypothetical protein
MELLDIATVAGASGYVASQLIDIAKPFIVYHLSDEVQTPALKLASLVITALAALLVGYAAERVGFLAPGAMWLVVLASFPAAGGWFQIESRRKQGQG